MAFEAIIEVAKKRNVTLATRPSALGNSNTQLVIVDRQTDRGSLNLFLSDLRKSGLQIQLAFADVSDDPFDSALRESIVTRFGEVIMDVSSSKTPQGTAISLIFFESEKYAATDFREHVQDLAKLFGIENVKLTLSERALRPGWTEFLQLVRLNAPCTCETIQTKIQQRGYPKPELDWINHQFDLHRKRGFLVRRDDRTYVLTLGGLAALGSAKGRYSPDVRRVLDLARREA